MFFEDPDDELSAVSEELRSRAGDELVEALQAIGVHVQARGLAIVEEQDASVAVIVSGVLGELAFSTRVLDPDSERIEEEFDVIADHYLGDEFEQRRRELMDGSGEGDNASQ